MNSLSKPFFKVSYKWKIIDRKYINLEGLEKEMILSS